MTLQDEWVRLRRVIVNESPGERSKGKCRLSLVGKVLMRDFRPEGWGRVILSVWELIG